MAERDTKEEEQEEAREEGCNANWGEAKKRIAEKENGAGEGRR